MRKITILFALTVVAAVLCSCNEESYQEEFTSEPGTLSLVMKGVETRSETLPSVQTFSYDLGKDETGLAFTLEETVTEMDGFIGPETKGTPAYTENVQAVYGNSFNGVIYGGSAQVVGDDAFSVMGGTGGSTGKPAIWRREIGFNPFETADPLTFFLRMPASATGVSGLTYNGSAGTIAFDYSTPATASAQQDILFATRTMTEADYKAESDANGGASVLFRHALTGVKFAIGNNASQNGIQTFITKVEITGLKDKGHAVFQPDNTSETNTDVTATHSSATSFTWTDVTGTSTETVFSQTYSSSNIVDFASGSAQGAPASFYAAGYDDNLNDANASMTFWFIPQVITSALSIKVTFYLKKDNQTEGFVSRELTLDLGSRILADTGNTTINGTWKAGQLRTFTLKPGAVDVDITDTVEGFTKSDVQIRNTGNVPAFIRAHIVANWYGTQTGGTDGIAIGYSTSTGDGFIQSWKMTGTTGDNYGGVFTGLPGTNWVRATDGFFYYTEPVPPGALTGQTSENTTGNPLFTSYSIDSSNVPDIWYLILNRKKFTNVRLVMEIPVQAIEAKEGQSYTDAWYAATGITVVPVTP